MRGKRSGVGVSRTGNVQYGEFAVTQHKTMSEAGDHGDPGNLTCGIDSCCGRGCRPRRINRGVLIPGPLESMGYTAARVLSHHLARRADAPAIRGGGIWEID